MELFHYGYNKNYCILYCSGSTCFSRISKCIWPWDLFCFPSSCPRSCNILFNLIHYCILGVIEYKDRYTFLSFMPSIPRITYKEFFTLCEKIGRFTICVMPFLCLDDYRKRKENRFYLYIMLIKYVQYTVALASILIEIEINERNMHVYLNYGDSRRPIECASGMEKMISSLAIRVALSNISNSLPG